MLTGLKNASVPPICLGELGAFFISNTRTFEG